MKLQFKYQKFQADAAKAVCDVFAGQPCLTPSYRMDRGSGYYQQRIADEESFIGWSNHKLVPELSERMILEQIRKVQRASQIRPSDSLEPSSASRINLTVEMETGVGKTYTYIKTMYELNKRYGWSKFIIVVPSIAVREGVYKSFQMTQDHFAEEYGRKIRFFIYNSRQLSRIDRFASDSCMNAMIINAQAFNARGKDANRIRMRLDEFCSRRPIDIIAKTNPILIIDEPQSVEGRQTRERLKDFSPLFTLRYSATPREPYNLIYRLDAMDAYNKRLVKRISVKGISESGSAATESYVYLESVNLSGAKPTATLQFDCRETTGVRKITRTVREGFSLYEQSNGLEEYRDNFTVRTIDGRDGSVAFLNGIKIFAGDVIGKVSEEQLRRIQIRETILSHIERERELFYRGIKVLSLFFIDEVAHYRRYDAAGNPSNGLFAQMFEEEYEDIVSRLPADADGDPYMRYLHAIKPGETHAGYFSIDKKGRMTDSKWSNKKERTSDDADAYDLIMRNKELLLDQDPARSPVRFLFSHSALREGWDNPNVFQICTLKQGASEIRKRQEVGRGLRLCVNQAGERMDASVLGEDVQRINVLTVIASESYESFARGLQEEIAEAVAERPRVVREELFIGRVLRHDDGNEEIIDSGLAHNIYFDLIVNGYLDRNGNLTDRYFADRAENSVIVTAEAADAVASILDILDAIYDPRAVQPENARGNNVELTVEEEKLAMPEFQELWSRICTKSAYEVEFDTDELVQKAIASLNRNLRVPKIYIRVESGIMDRIESREDLLSGVSFTKKESGQYRKASAAGTSAKYDLIGKLVEATGLTRRATVSILQGMEKAAFAQFKDNPEEFIIRAAELINEEKASAIVQHISYHKLEETYDLDIFTKPVIKGKLGVNAFRTGKHLYDYVVCDSENEQTFAIELDTNRDVAVYVKLPGGFYISTPVGRYHPDWAIAFYEGTVKHIYFVAETKGSMRSMDLRGIEKAKIYCAQKHFEAISSGKVKYHVVTNYSDLLDIASR